MMLEKFSYIQVLDDLIQWLLTIKLDSIQLTDIALQQYIKQPQSQPQPQSQSQLQSQSKRPNPSKKENKVVSLLILITLKAMLIIMNI